MDDYLKKAREELEEIGRNFDNVKSKEKSKSKPHWEDDYPHFYEVKSKNEK